MRNCDLINLYKPKFSPSKMYTCVEPLALVRIDKTGGNVCVQPK